MSLLAPPESNGAQPSDHEHLELPGEKKGLYERFMALVPDVRGELDELEAQKQTLTEAYQIRLAALDAKKKKLVSLLRALGEDAPVRPKRKATSDSDGRNVSEPVLLKIIDHILGLETERFTALDVHEALGKQWSEPQTYQAIRWLRAMEFIGKAGFEGQRTQFRILDREIGQQIRQNLLAAAASPKGKKPSPEAIERVITAARALGKDSFTIIEVSEQIGLASPKHAYEVFRHLKAVGAVSEVGTQPGEDGRHPRALYRLNEELIHA